MNEPSPSDEERPFYFTRAALEKYHSRLFSGEPSFSVAERPISETSRGLVDAVLRVPANYPEKEECLRTCLLQLASTYSVNNNWNFLVTVTGNAVLRSEDTGTFSVYYGQDFAQRRGDFEADIYDTNTVVVNGLQDLRKINFGYDLNDFESLHTDTFKNADSNVSIDSLISVVYTIRVNLDDFIRDRRINPLMAKGKIEYWKFEKSSQLIRCSPPPRGPTRPATFEAVRGPRKKRARRD